MGHTLYLPFRGLLGLQCGLKAVRSSGGRGFLRKISIVFKGNCLRELECHTVSSGNAVLIPSEVERLIPLGWGDSFHCGRRDLYHWQRKLQNIGSQCPHFHQILPTHPIPTYTIPIFPINTLTFIVDTCEAGSPTVL